MVNPPINPAAGADRQGKPGPKTLAGVIGSVLAAGALMVMVPQNESGGRHYLAAYRDIAGVWTIGDGYTRWPDGRPVKAGDKATQAQLDAMLESELIRHAEPIIACVPQLKGRANQVVAAVDLSYNIGAAGFCKSSVAREFRAGRWRSGCDRILVFNKARVNGVLRPVKGLTARRQRERALCLKDL
jgi:lysozyme